MSIHKGSEKGIKPGKVSGIARLQRAALYSWAGLQAAYIEEAAFRQEVWLALVLIPVAMFLPVSLMMRIFLVGCVLLVLVVELLNSAVEAIVDLASPEYHMLAARAKDMGSAAVLVSLLILGIAWGGVLLVFLRDTLL